MIKKVYPILLFVVISLLQANCKASDWQQLTLIDLHTMHDILIKNTPQYYEKYRPFMEWLETGLDRSLQLATKVNTKAAYFYTLSYYANGFNNGHIKVTLNNEQFTYKYASLLATYLNGYYLVSHVEQNKTDLPPLGAKIINCDNEPVDKLVEKDIIAFSFTPKLEASYRNAANNLFFDSNPLRYYPKNCIFEFQGKKFSRPIHWNVISKKDAQNIKALYHKQYEFLLKPFDSHGLWIAIPTLYPLDNQRKFLEMLVSMAPKYRNFDPIVLDVRGNHGGNSSWAKHILERIYGKEYAQPILAEQSERQLFRVTPSNIAKLKSVAQLYPDLNKDVVKLENAQKKGIKMFTFGQKQNVFTQTTKLSNFHNHIYFLTDHNCFSSCLDFADYISLLPNTTHIGLTTNADSPYTENNNIIFPSGVNFMFTMTHDLRTRGENIPYIPKYKYDGDISNTKALMQWVQNLYTQNKF